MINLVLEREGYTSFCADHLQPILRRYFNVVYVEDNVNVPNKNTVVFCKIGSQLAQQYKSRDYKLAYDHLWEKYNNTQPDQYICYNDNWFWYNESLWYTRKGYDKYAPDKTYSKSAFMPIRTGKQFRLDFLDSLGTLTQDMIYSCVERNILLPNDLANGHPDFQRYFNPAWYNDTCYSLVLETLISCSWHQGVNSNPEVFATEKSFKPFAFYHPVLIFGQPGILAHLHNLGFETFENIFDESYDTVLDLKQRQNQVIENVKNFQIQQYDTLTWEKLRHNRNRFFDTQLIEKLIIDEIIMPLIEYAET